MPQPHGYRGRFAPSPTGPLHLGSLIAATASYLDARSRDGLWLLRMEDLDPPREQPGAARAIIDSLRAHGLHWDGDILWQGQRQQAYQQALDQLSATGLLFHCDCSRARLGPNGSCRGRCAPRQRTLDGPTALRVAVPPGTGIQFDDRIQGPQQLALDEEVTDFVLRRRDGLIAYQLAVVVDDAAQQITEVVRGSDLLDSTPRQLYLQGLLGLPRPRYAHIPVISNEQDQKLSKQTHAPALDDGRASANLRRALAFLRQTPPPMRLDSPVAVLDWARGHWQPQHIPARLSIRENEAAAD